MMICFYGLIGKSEGCKVADRKRVIAINGVPARVLATPMAKVDCVESRLPVRRKFLDFENHFGTRLERLFLALKEDDFERIRRLCKFGYYLVPKKAVEKQSVEMLGK